MTIRNLEHALRPRSVALIGASDEAGSVGQKLTENLLTGGFAGPVYLVNPKHRDAIKGSSVPQEFLAYLKQFPHGCFRAVAIFKIKSLVPEAVPLTASVQVAAEF